MMDAELVEKLRAGRISSEVFTAAADRIEALSDENAALKKKSRDYEQCMSPRKVPPGIYFCLEPKGHAGYHRDGAPVETVVQGSCSIVGARSTAPGFSAFGSRNPEITDASSTGSALPNAAPGASISNVGNRLCPSCGAEMMLYSTGPLYGCPGGRPLSEFDFQHSRCP